MLVLPICLIVKKLLLLNVVVLLVIFLVSVLPDYYVNYPVYYSFMNTIEQFQWTPIVYILIAGVLLSGALGYYKFKSAPYLHRFLTINILLDITFLLAISFEGTVVVLKTRAEYESISSQYKAKAKSDIRNGLIIYESMGFPMSMDSKIQEDKIDSIMGTYGIAYNFGGCVITGPLLKAQSDYKTITESYLDKRNGKGWRERMNRQIAEIRNN